MLRLAEYEGSLMNIYFEEALTMHQFGCTTLRVCAYLKQSEISGGTTRLSI